MQLDRFINRPVLSTVISVVIVILGVLGVLLVHYVETTPRLLAIFRG